MASKKIITKESRPFLIFYIFAFYVLSFLVWWTILLGQKNQEVYDERFEIEQFKYEQSAYPEARPFEETELYADVMADYKRQRLMVYSEGIVFTIIMLIFLWKVRNTFNKEIELARQQRNFILSITHELKSPVSSIKLVLQTLYKRELPREQQIKLTNNALHDTDRLESLIDNILFAAKIENDAYGFAFEPLDLSVLVHSVASMYEMNNELAINIEEGIVVNADRMAMMSVITNLIENALKYSPDSKRVQVTLKSHQDEAELLIADEGLGIPDNEKSRIFEKFYRVGNEDTRRAKGTGLGLYIVKRVVQIHQGKISVHDNQPKGSVFKMLLKRA